MNGNIQHQCAYRWRIHALDFRRRDLFTDCPLSSIKFALFISGHSSAVQLPCFVHDFHAYGIGRSLQGIKSKAAAAVWKPLRKSPVKSCWAKHYHCMSCDRSSYRYDCAYCSIFHSLRHAYQAVFNTKKESINFVTRQIM